MTELGNSRLQLTSMPETSNALEEEQHLPKQNPSHRTQNKAAHITKSSLSTPCNQAKNAFLLGIVNSSSEPPLKINLRWKTLPSSTSRLLGQPSTCAPQLKSVRWRWATSLSLCIVLVITNAWTSLCHCFMETSMLNRPHQKAPLVSRRLNQNNFELS